MDPKKIAAFVGKALVTVVVQSTMNYFADKALDQKVASTVSKALDKLNKKGV